MQESYMQESNKEGLLTNKDLKSRDLAGMDLIVICMVLTGMDLIVISMVLIVIRRDIIVISRDLRKRI